MVFGLKDASYPSPPPVERTDQRMVSQSLRRLLFVSIIALAVLLPVYFGPISILKSYDLESATARRRFTTFWIAFVTYTFPFFAGYVLRKAASKVAMRTMQSTDCSAAEICSLYSIACEGSLGPRQYARLMNTSKGERIAIVIRIFGDLIVFFGTPFVSLAFYTELCYNSDAVLIQGAVCIGYNWPLLVCALLWPLMCLGLVCLILIIVRQDDAPDLQTALPVPLQTAADLATFGDMRRSPSWDDKNHNPVLIHDGRWRYGERQGLLGPEIGVFLVGMLA